MQVSVIAIVNDVQNSGNRHTLRVKTSFGAKWAPVLPKRKTQIRNISSVHRDKVTLHSVLELGYLILPSVQSHDQLVKADEVDVVGQVDQQEEANDVFLGQIEDQNSNQNENITEQQELHCVDLVISVVA